MKKLVNLMLALFLSLFITNVFADRVRATGEFKRASECKAYSKEHGNGNFKYRDEKCDYWTNIGQTDNKPRYKMKLNKKFSPRQ